MMRGVLLAGGTGSRLSPLTDVSNKHLLPVGRKPMIYYPIESMLQVGVREILITTGTHHAGQIFQLLGSGSRFGARFTYRVQDEAGGIAQALMLAEDFARDGTMMVVLGDNIFGQSLGLCRDVFEKMDADAGLVLKEVSDPERFGVADIHEGRVTSIVEKPKSPKSNLAVTGCYFYKSNVFNVIHDLKPSDRGEFEISDVNMYYVENGVVSYQILEDWWTDAGTFESLKKANRLV